jgi:hypothetical protein
MISYSGVGFFAFVLRSNNSSKNWSTTAQQQISYFMCEGLVSEGFRVLEWGACEVAIGARVERREHAQSRPDTWRQPHRGGSPGPGQAPLQRFPLWSTAAQVLTFKLCFSWMLACFCFCFCVFTYICTWRRNNTWISPLSLSLNVFYSVSHLFLLSTSH